MFTFILTIAAIVAVIIAMFVITKIEFFNRDIFRFILTGGFNTFNYYLMYLILFEVIQWPYLYAHITAFLYSAFCSFFVTTIYTFNKRPTWKKFIAFPITFLPNLIISTLGTILLVRNDILTETYASLIAMFIAIPITFLISKFILTSELTEDSKQ